MTQRQERMVIVAGAVLWLVFSALTLRCSGSDMAVMVTTNTRTQVGRLVKLTNPTNEFSGKFTATVAGNVLTNGQPWSITNGMISPGAVGATELAASGVTAGSYTQATWTVDADGRLTAATRYTPLEANMTNGSVQTFAASTVVRVQFGGSDPTYQGQAAVADLTNERFQLPRAGYWQGVFSMGWARIAASKNVQLLIYRCSAGVSNYLPAAILTDTSIAGAKPLALAWACRTTGTTEWLEGMAYQSDANTRTSTPARVQFVGKWIGP